MIETLDISNVEPRVLPTKIQVTALPEGHPEANSWSVYVEYRGPGSYAVVHYGQNLSKDGTWDYEPSNSSREDDFISTHRFSYDEAVSLAKKACKEIIVNSMTAADVLTMDTLSPEEVAQYHRERRAIRVREWFEKTFAPIPEPSDLSESAKDKISDIIVEVVANLYRNKIINVDEVKKSVLDITGWDGLAVNEALVYGIKQGKFTVDRDLFLIFTTDEAYDEVKLKTKR